MARKKFSAKEIGKKGGLISTRHTVRMNDGTSKTFISKPSSVRKGERDQNIRISKRDILNRLPSQEARIRTLMLSAINDVEKLILNSDSSRDKDGQLRVKNKKQVRSQIRRIVDKAILDAGGQLLNNVKGSVKTYSTAVNKGLPSDKKMKRKEIDEISDSVSKQVLRQGSGKMNQTTKNRLNVLANKMYVLLESQVNRSRIEREKYLPSLKKQLVDPKGSHRSCVARGLARINRTEQNKAMHEATLKILKDKDIGFAYWRLSNAHKSYGGSEVCEVLASNNNLNGQTLPSSVSLNGLYSVDSFPSVPHANCMCSIEPLVL